MRPCGSNIHLVASYTGFVKRWAASGNTQVVTSLAAVGELEQRSLARVSRSKRGDTLQQPPVREPHVGKITHTSSFTSAQPKPVSETFIDSATDGVRLYHQERKCINRKQDPASCKHAHAMCAGIISLIINLKLSKETTICSRLH